MYGPHYVWMLVNSYNNNWWIPGKNEELACSDLEMKCQIQNHFSFYHTFVINQRKRYYNHAKKVSVLGQYLSRDKCSMQSIVHCTPYLQWVSLRKSLGSNSVFSFLFTEWVSNNQ